MPNRCQNIDLFSGVWLPSWVKERRKILQASPERCLHSGVSGFGPCGTAIALRMKPPGAAVSNSWAPERTQSRRWTRSLHDEAGIRSSTCPPSCWRSVLLPLAGTDSRIRPGGLGISQRFRGCHLATRLVLSVTSRDSRCRVVEWSVDEPLCQCRTSRMITVRLMKKMMVVPVPHVLRVSGRVNESSSISKIGFYFHVLVPCV